MVESLRPQFRNARGINSLEELMALPSYFVTVLKVEDNGTPKGWVSIMGTLTGKGIAGGLPQIQVREYDDFETMQRDTMAFRKEKKPDGTEVNHEVTLSEETLKQLILHCQENNLVNPGKVPDTIYDTTVTQAGLNNLAKRLGFNS